ncbi:hypothetical protein FNV43_RR21027 [Rhamnella rubrinervis]|uniref:CCT domain-containing protein n=1 Tax=Rhamnella rubrinervis TaxID=2594499 RepID=A0A8K0GUQ7_9ROSA|nr:hypothetical protein FNV43_RR21027 [Rhamnella rubrinervis]
MGSLNPQFYSDVYAFPATDQLSGFSPAPPVSTSNGCAMWGSEDNFIIPMIDDNGVLDDLSSPDSDMRSSVMAIPGLFPHDQQLGVLDGVGVPAAAAFSDYNSSSRNNMGGLHGISVMQNDFGQHVVGYQPADQTCEFRDECYGLFMPDFKPLGIVSTDNWGIQSNQIHGLEDSNIKVGRYSEEERKKRILRYLEKRHQRNFNKTIKYACRKTLADRRVRVRGRFARNNELRDHQEIMVPKKSNDIIIPTRKDRSEVCCVDAHVQMKYDEEEWLQEAMASLMCLPYVAG